MSDDPPLDDGLWPAPPPPPPQEEQRHWIWAAMQPHDRRQRLRELRDWVAWLRREHAQHNAIPPCWYRHRPAREILTALYIGWVRIYAGQQPPGSPLAEADWITTMHSLIPRLHLAPCASSRHQPPPGHADTATPAEADDDFELWLAAADDMRQPAQHPAAAEARRHGKEPDPPS